MSIQWVVVQWVCDNKYFAQQNVSRMFCCNECFDVFGSMALLLNYSFTNMCFQWLLFHFPISCPTRLLQKLFKSFGPMPFAAQSCFSRVAVFCDCCFHDWFVQCFIQWFACFKDGELKAFSQSCGLMCFFRSKDLFSMIWFQRLLCFDAFVCFNGFLFQCVAWFWTIF